MNIVDKIEQSYCKKTIPNFRGGDIVKVFVKIKEGDKERVQIFEGAVLRRRGGGSSESITVRKVAFGVGVERIFPIHSPIIEKIEVVQQGNVRQSRIYYLRDLTGKKARIQIRDMYASEVGSGESGGEATGEAAAGKSKAASK